MKLNRRLFALPTLALLLVASSCGASNRALASEARNTARSASINATQNRDAIASLRKELDALVEDHRALQDRVKLLEEK